MGAEKIAIVVYYGTWKYCNLKNNGAQLKPLNR